MTLTFYYAPMSTASVTHLVIEELGVPVEKVKLDFSKGDTKKPDFMKLNPNAKVPCLVHDGTPLWESAALTMYLGELFGVDKKLYPAPGPKRGEAMKWIVWTNVTLGEAVYRIGRNTQWAPEDQRNAKAAEQAVKDVQDLLKILDGALEGKQYLVGDYTIADTHVHAFTDWLRHMKTDFSTFKNINAWSERCGARPAYKKVMAEG
ncbi:MAG: Glutathione S-transferase domain protein [Deltaproteobacteria bacterium]|nr:Glutathione S-transferase domain protein [Deltaproteobacteria bacterium]